MNQTKTENKLVMGTMFAFGVSGAGSLALGSLIPFLRETYGLSYDFTGMLVSLQSLWAFCPPSWAAGSPL